jgi:hypothetical protein
LVLLEVNSMAITQTCCEDHWLPTKYTFSLFSQTNRTSLLTWPCCHQLKPTFATMLVAMSSQMTMFHRIRSKGKQDGDFPKKERHIFLSSSILPPGVWMCWPVLPREGTELSQCKSNSWKWWESVLMMKSPC